MTDDGAHDGGTSTMRRSGAPSRHVLARIPLFADLLAEELDEFARHFEEVRLPAHARIFGHGDPADYFYVVRSGGVTLFRDEVGRPMQLIARLGAEEFFGEMGIFDGVTRTAAARTTEPTLLLRVSKWRLLQVLDTYPGIALKLQIAAARRHSENVAAALDLGKRQDLRIRLDQRVDLDLEGAAPRRVVLENLSFGGLCLRGPLDMLAEGDRVGCRLTSFGQTLEVEGRVTWIQEDRVGIAFTKPRTDRDDEVQDFLRHLLR
ncbi:MAG: cyclic nucleotide-binding domain-containing protein [Acidobacteriota bacterium]